MLNEISADFLFGENIHKQYLNSLFVIVMAVRGEYVYMDFLLKDSVKQLCMFAKKERYGRNAW